MTLSPGTTVWLKREQGDWVVHSRLGDRYKCLGKTSVGRNHDEVLTARIVGEGDAVLIKAAPTYTPGQTVTYNGVPHTIVRDDGDTVTLEVPASRYQTHGGDHLHIDAGNDIVVSKCELVMKD